MRALLLVAFALYPLLVYFGLLRWQPRAVALAMAGALAARALITRALRQDDPAGSEPDAPAASPTRRRPGLGGGPLLRLALPALLVGGVIGGAAWRNDQTLLLFVPTAINAVLLATFAVTLARPPSMIETFARAWVEDLSAPERAHCRRVTWIWCAFFVANGAVAAWLAVGGRTLWWSLYNGLIAYALIGGLVVGEMAFRAWRFRRYVGEPLDPLLRRLFPPRSASAALADHTPDAEGAST